MTPRPTAPLVYGGQMRCGPSQPGSYIDAYGSGVSNGSCGSDPSTNSKKGWGWAASSSSHRAAAASVRGPGKSDSSLNQPRELSYGMCPRPNDGAPNQLRSGQGFQRCPSCPGW